MNFKKMILRTSLVLPCLATLIFASSAYAMHPYHVSATEICWNAKTGNFEVALCVWPADLEKAIAKQQKTKIDLDEVENVDELIEQYVATRFAIRSLAAGADKPKPGKIRWVGHEMDLKKAWLYFEVVGDKKDSSAGNKWQVENRVFFELNEDQINQIQLQTSSGVRSESLTASQAKIDF